jgi:hypothetical protein
MQAPIAASVESPAAKVRIFTLVILMIGLL